MESEGGSGIKSHRLSLTYDDVSTRYTVHDG